MNDVWFSEPVILDFRDSGERKVASCFEALECMGDQWPMRDRAWKSAIRACRDALDGLKSAVEARRAFCRAARSARLLYPLRERRAARRSPQAAVFLEQSQLSMVRGRRR
ncbi:MAG TPA: DUF982 domain-containing protein [Mesorhizobium sp.]|jgi:hypothetical protein|uniref:DUF982 domain-containing protein n=1 Tax=Mesorhizobium sp. TaxID=1871066 RepID=UPI002DDCBE59|nr:DUF982 domain-containing protein [Mesorhizobium sp.]HEV2503634.1 DUF982 domain-containing protein [Mesorhizobium sp.]